MTLDELELIKSVLIEYSIIKPTEPVFKALDLVSRQIHLKTLDPRTGDTSDVRLRSGL